MNDDKFYKITDLDLLQASLQKRFSIETIADYCQVSRQVLYRRMKKLNIITRDLKTNFAYVKRLIAYDRFYKMDILQRHLNKINNVIKLSERNPNVDISINYKKELEDIIEFMNANTKL